MGPAIVDPGQVSVASTSATPADVASPGFPEPKSAASGEMAQEGIWGSRVLLVGDTAVVFFTSGGLGHTPGLGASVSIDGGIGGRILVWGSASASTYGPSRDDSAIIGELARSLKEEGIEEIEQLIGSREGDLLRIWAVTNEIGQAARMRTYETEGLILDRYPDVEIRFSIIRRQGRPLHSLLSVRSDSDQIHVRDLHA